ncbi:hypothetical protein HaLaN_27678 [Haematococcus lacustris]|uniref:Uncharacterized protein n=1 Tax=Haematococcus lacustris TaxID=44745 RepID=A0A6A0A9J1_HAELA|nr:hypothetical protein HaLaN_27678 [Haematococcus lacustris]
MALQHGWFPPQALPDLRPSASNPGNLSRNNQSQLQEAQYRRRLAREAQASEALIGRRKVRGPRLNHQPQQFMHRNLPGNSWNPPSPLTLAQPSGANQLLVGRCLQLLAPALAQHGTDAGQYIVHQSSRKQEALLPASAISTPALDLSRQVSNTQWDCYSKGYP